MEKSILTQYLSAVKLINYTEGQINRLKTEKTAVVSDTVTGSNPNFPYEPRIFKVEGFGSAAFSDEQIRRLEKILTQRKKAAAELRVQVEEWLNTLPVRMQVIVELKYFNNYTWEEVSREVGKGTTPAGLKMEYKRFMDGIVSEIGAE
jgi:DNA-directed RNA polymerase specialized sigma24 family protein